MGAVGLPPPASGAAMSWSGTKLMMTVGSVWDLLVANPAPATRSASKTAWKTVDASKQGICRRFISGAKVRFGVKNCGFRCACNGQ